jgi:hypothetical protein
LKQVPHIISISDVDTDIGSSEPVDPQAELLLKLYGNHVPLSERLGNDFLLVERQKLTAQDILRVESIDRFLSGDCLAAYALHYARPSNKVLYLLVFNHLEICDPAT